MTSRLSALAALFAVLVTTLAVLSTANVATAAQTPALDRAAATMAVYTLERVVVTGKRAVPAVQTY